ncbi:glycosyltransferase family 9 protein [Aquifex sp.]
MRVLLIQRRALGDALYTSLIGKVIKRELPRSRVGFLTLKPMCNLTRKFNFIDECFGYTDFWNILRKIRSFSPDVVLDYEATAKTYPLVFLSGAKKRVAFYGKLRERFLYPIYTHILKKESTGYTFWDRLKLLEPLGINYRRYLNTFIPLEENHEEENYIVFIPKGKIETKVISPERVKEIKDRIESELGVEVKVFVDPSEEAYIKELERRGVRPYRVSLGKFYEYTKKSKGVLSIEGFPQHLGLLLGKRVLTVVQSRLPWFKETFGRLFYYYPPLSCLGCNKNICPKGTYECVYRIDVGSIIEELKEKVLNPNPPAVQR